MTRVGLATVILAVLAAVSLACNLTGATVTPTVAPVFTDTPTAIPPAETLTPTPAGAGTISGRVWHDLCNPGPDGGPTPTAAPSGCTGDTTTGYGANGTYEAGEPFIAGVLVRLGAGACPSTGLAEAVTIEADPSYSFAGLSAGEYCVSIDPLREPNLGILIPGGWTYPARVDGANSTTITLGAGETRDEMDFGWDYQFLPVSGEATATSTPVANGEGAARINFEPGAVWAAASGSVAFPEREEYLLRAQAGQQLGIQIESEGAAANFSIVGVTNGEPYKRLENESREWTGRLTVTQDYLISVAVPDGNADYQLLVVVLPQAGAGILGTLWLDYCTLMTGTGASDGCVEIGSSAFRANGVFDDTEGGIEGVVVALKAGDCPGGAEIATATTNERGEYFFSSLEAGDYCVVIDPLRAENSSILIPGEFSYPEVAVGEANVTLAEEQIVPDRNFGWDLQFD